MIKDNILFHNVDELEETKLGYRLYRYKNSVSEKMNAYARDMNRLSCGCELRFVTESSKIRVTVFCEDPCGTILVYCGDHIHSSYNVTEIGFKSLIIEECPDFLKMHEEFFKNSRFDKNVWRICFSGFRCTFVDIDTYDFPVRPPKDSEMPDKTLLSYGSSISQGAMTLSRANTFPQVFSQLAGMDCLTKGLGGSCHAEKEIADDFAQRKDWDMALIEIGINMISKFETDEFEKRFNYFADKIASTGKKFIVLTVFPCSHDYCRTEHTDKLQAFREIIRTKCSKLDKEQHLLIEGNEILTNPLYLTCDCVHPSTEGHLMMGYNLYQNARLFLKE